MAEWTHSRILHLAEASEVEFAVRACNCHDDLVAALRDARDELFLYVGIDNPAVDRADAALAKAGEE